MSSRTEDEIIGVFMRNSKFMIASIHDNVFFRTFIASIVNGPSHVRFDFFGFFPGNDPVTGKHIPENSDLLLAVDCKGLHTLQLTLKVARLLQPVEDEDTGDWMHTPYTVGQLVEKYRLRKLLGCTQLRKIHWDGRRGNRGSAAQVLRDLAD
jgi:hypothetical protein